MLLLQQNQSATPQITVLLLQQDWLTCKDYLGSKNPGPALERSSFPASFPIDTMSSKAYEPLREVSITVRYGKGYIIHMATKKIQ